MGFIHPLLTRLDSSGPVFLLAHLLRVRLTLVVESWFLTSYKLPRRTLEGGAAGRRQANG